MGIKTSIRWWMVIFGMIKDKTKEYNKPMDVTIGKEETKMGQKIKLGHVDVKGYEKWFKYVTKNGDVFAVERSAKSRGIKNQTMISEE